VDVPVPNLAYGNCFSEEGKEQIFQVSRINPTKADTKRFCGWFVDIQG
jgi:hypothetical protein